MVMGRFHGYPEVQPWDTLHVVSLTEPTDGNAIEIDVFTEMNGGARGFILTDAMVLDCIAWGNSDQETFIAVGFTAGAHFGMLRKFKTKGTGSNTDGDATTITLFK